jgi:hypothetical protein
LDNDERVIAIGARYFYEVARIAGRIVSERAG